MIIRKPYAFLIKYFKLIHIILFFGNLYLLIKTRNIYLFFQSYAKLGTYNYFPNMALSYVNFYMIIIAILLVAFLVSIYFLMKQKEKKVLLYLFATIFYFLSFGIYIYFISVFNSLEYTSFNNQLQVLFRDISMIFYYLNYIFLVVFFVRGFGFNVKKFNFEKDLKDLDISEEDREEIEVGSGIDYENIGNFVRRKKRNFKYYIKENSFILIMFFITIILIVTSHILINNLVTNKIYKENEVIIIDDINYLINSSYVIDKDLDGNIIKKDKKYLIIDYNVLNNSSSKTIIDINNSRIKIGDKYYYPKTNLNNSFLEFGNIYNREYLNSKENKNYILVFEIDYYSDTLLELYERKYSKGEEVLFSYKNIDLDTYKFIDNSIGEYKLNDVINLESTYFKRGNLKIISYEVLDTLNYSYEKCSNDSCKTYNKTISVNNNNKILKIQYEKDFNRDIFKYLKVEYNNIKYDISDITPSNYLENTVLFEIPSIIETNDINLLFNVRGINFIVS